MPKRKTTLSHDLNSTSTSTKSVRSVAAALTDVVEIGRRLVRCRGLLKTQAWLAGLDQDEIWLVAGDTPII